MRDAPVAQPLRNPGQAARITDTRAMPKPLIVCALASLLSGATLAQQAPPAEARQLYLRTLAAGCAQCHGTSGKPIAGSDIAPLAGMPRDELIRHLTAFKTGTRPATVMHQISKGYSDDQIGQLADYFSAARP